MLVFTSAYRSIPLSEGRLLRLATIKNMGMPFPYAVKKARSKPREHEESVEANDRSVAQELLSRAAMLGTHFSTSSISNTVEGSRGG